MGTVNDSRLAYTTSTPALPAHLAELLVRAEKQAQIRPADWRGRPYSVWRAEERAYTRWRDFERMITRAPYPPRRIGRGWDLRGGRTKYAAVDPLAYLVGRNPQSFTRTDRIEW